MQAEVVIIGGGPGGTTSALRLIERGITPVIVEREQFPRYHIGESMTGECAAILRDLGFGDRMLAAKHPIKQGVNVWGKKGTHRWWIPVMRRDTHGGALQEQFAWQVRRSEFDSMLLDEARARGAEVVHGRAVEPLITDDGTAVRGVRVRTVEGTEVDIEADLTFDCSGQASFLSNQQVTGPKYLGAYDKQIAIFGQVDNYVRGDGSIREETAGNTHIFYKEKYHWAWAIPIDDDVTSIGIVVPAQYFRDTGESKADFIHREMRSVSTNMTDRVSDSSLVDEPHVARNYSFQVKKFAGPGYICIGDAHRFVDPIFSFGLYITMAEAGFAAEAAEQYLAGKGRDSDDPFRDYMVFVEEAIDNLEDTIDTFWENPLAFSVFAHDRYREPLVDLFAGRIYDGMPNDGLDKAVGAFRSLLKRERTYDDDLFSVPIGSRFHPERAPLWDSQLNTVETTEEWIKDRDTVA